MDDNSYRAELEGMYFFVKADDVGLEDNQMSMSYLKIKEVGNSNKAYIMLLKLMMTKLKTHL
ncbi:hypothetical protein [Wolbachia endosymbiont of Mansonella perstans]|uniref:hypothetical protein n=1 Tax=Wolbachia endosymbiont of Mansonella perstans TaxID=229526 RepID=UPI001CE0C363|nr:hypothetical protein [Wolbachia endosymbiont of Mansonella perstans]